MDNSIKIPKEDIIKINELKLELMKENIKITQKDIIDKAIKFSFNRKIDFIKQIKNKKIKKKEGSLKNLLCVETFDLGKNWIKDIDTTL